MALNGKTPAEKVGIDLDLGEQKWEELIKQGMRAGNGDKEVLAKRLLENKSLDSYY